MFVENGDGGGKRNNARLSSREMAIKFINPEAMVGLSYKKEYGRSIPRDIRRPLMWLMAPEVKYLAHPTATKLNQLVQAANDCKIPAARADIKLAVDYGLISEERDGREVFYYLNAEQFAKAQKVLAYLDQIPEVVRMQAADPFNPTAGNELLPPDIYYNIIAVADFPSQT